MAFKPSPAASVNQEIIEYPLYFLYLKNQYLNTIKMANGVEYQKYRSMAYTEKEKFLGEYAKKEIEKIALAIATGDASTKQSIQEGLINTYDSDNTKIAKLISEFEVVGNEILQAKKDNSNKPASSVKPTSSAEPKSAAFLGFFKNKEANKEPIPEDALLNSTQKSYFLKEVEKYNENLPAERKKVAVWGIFAAISVVLTVLAATNIINVFGNASILNASLFEKVVAIMTGVLGVIGVGVIPGIVFLDKLTDLTNKQSEINLIKGMLLKYGNNQQPEENKEEEEPKL